MNTYTKEQLDRLDALCATAPPPLFARATDPDTSLDAGRDATAKHSDHEAATWVLQVLQGTKQALNDEEIVQIAREVERCPLSPQRLRAGRKHAADIGLIECVGRVPLASGSMGRTWRLKGESK